MTRKNSSPTPRICNFARWLVSALLLGLLVACGSGDGDEPVSATTSAALAGGLDPTPTHTASPLTAATTCSLTAFQSAVLAEVNLRRASAQSCGSRGAYAAANNLRWNDTLFEAAAAHALDMVSSNTVSHTGSNGSSISDRINAIGYAWASIGENIAAGQPTVARVVDAWMASDGHCANLMNPAMEEFAVACVYNTVNRSNYWVMDLAKPR